MKINVNIDISSMDVSKLIKELDKACEEAITKCALKIEADAKELCPVDTGRLRDSINTVFSNSGHEFSAEIGTDVEYAPYIEYGTGIYNPNGRKEPWVYRDDEGNYHFTHGMQAQPFMYPAFNQNKVFIQKYLAERISKVMGG